MNIIRTNRLGKVLNKAEVVSDVNMCIKKGEIYGFLGPNGAGKTTIFKMILNLLKPTSGEIVVFDEVIRQNSYEYLKRIGSLIEYPVFYDGLTAFENLEIHCEYMGYYKENAIEETLRLVNLAGVNNKKVKEFSLGMKQRLGIARALITKPEILVLDEPINGLDPLGIVEVRQLLKMLSRDYGMTILISSHIISEIELIADRIGVINKGKLVKEFTVEQAKIDHAGYIEVKLKDIDKGSRILDTLVKSRNFKVISDQQIKIYDTEVSVGDITKAFVTNNIEILSITQIDNTLEEYFINLVDGGDIIA